MRVGLLTFHFSENFGALLQAYALRRWFLERGHLAFFIDYCPSHVEAGGGVSLSLSQDAVRASLKSIYLRLTTEIHERFGDQDQKKLFAEFRRSYLGVESSGDRASNFSEVASNCDLIVAGSDQIWNPSVQFGFDPMYFLSFAAQSSARRISYAASFGRDHLPPEQMRELAGLLSELDSVSVRERSGVDIVRNANGSSAHCVADPTLLHSSYGELLPATRERREQDYVFCYALRTAEGIRTAATSVATSLNAQILSPFNAHRRWRQIGRTTYPGPREWVAQIAEARCVVTNSFHGAVFSVLLRKPFLVVEMPGARSAMNARSINLLSMLGLMDRYVSTRDASGAHRLMGRPIDWELVAAKQASLRAQSVQFLEREVDLTFAAIRDRNVYV